MEEKRPARHDPHAVLSVGRGEERIHVEKVFMIGQQDDFRKNTGYLGVLVLGLIAYLFYQNLISSTPTIYWNDAHIRWAMRDQLVLGKWLPGVQVFVFLVSKMAFDLAFLRSVLAVIAIGTLLSFFLLARHLFSAAVGVIAFAFLAFNKMFAAFAVVPYSEVLFLGFLFGVLVLLDSTPFSFRYFMGVLLVNLACLISYEGWFIALLLVLDAGFFLFHRMKWKEAFVRTVILFLLVSVLPLTWLLLNGLEDGGFWAGLQQIFEFVIAPSTPSVQDHLFARMNFEYLTKFSAQFFYLLVSQIRVEFFLLAGLGVLFAAADVKKKKLHLQIFFILVLHMLLLAFFQPWKFGSLRQPFLLLPFLLLYSAYGLNQSLIWLFQRFPSLGVGRKYLIPTLAFFAAAFLSALSIPPAKQFVLETSREYKYFVPYKLSHWLSSRFVDGDVVLIVDDTDYYPYALAAYFDMPLDFILDDRLAQNEISQALLNGRNVYVLELYTSRDGLSADEQDLLFKLETGGLNAVRYTVESANVWYLPSHQLLESYGE